MTNISLAGGTVSVVETGGVLEVTPSSDNYRGIVSVDTYDMTGGGQVTAKALRGSDAVQAYMALCVGDYVSEWAQINSVGNMIQVNRGVDNVWGAIAVENPEWAEPLGTPQWWRIKENAGDLEFATSPDGVTWTTRATYTTPTWDLAATHVSLEGGRWGSAAGSPIQRFDDLNIAVASGSGGLTIQKPALAASGTVTTAGNTGSLIFDGVNDYASTPSHADLNITGDCTIEAWVKASNWSPAVRSTIYGKGKYWSDNQHTPLALIIGYDQVLAGWANNFNMYETPTGADLSGVSTGAWHHFAVTYTASTKVMRLYVDGTLSVTSPAQANGPIANSYAASVGANWNSNGSVYADFLAARVDEIRVWNVVRSGAQIADYRDLQATGSETGLVACWHANEGSGTSVADAAGTAQNLTLSGATWSTTDYPTLTDAGGPAAISGTGALSIQKPALAATGTNLLAIAGTGSLTSQKPVIAAAAVEEFASTAAALTIQKPVLAVAAVQQFVSTAALSIQKPTFAAAGSESFTGTSALSIQKPALAITGSETFTGTSAVSIQTPTLAASGVTQEQTPGTAALTIQKPALAANGTAQDQLSATAAFSIQKPTLAATGSALVSGTATLSIQKPTLVATGAAQDQLSGTAALSIQKPTLAATGSALVSGTATLSIQKPTLAASGTAQDQLAGTAALSIQRPSLAGTGSETFTGTSAFSIRKPTLAASGVSQDQLSGTAALSIQKPTLAATGSALVSGTAALSIQKPALAATAAETHAGPVALSIQRPTLAATATQSFTGTAALNISAPSIAASSSSEIAGTAALTIQRPTLDGLGAAIAEVSSDAIHSVASQQVAAAVSGAPTVQVLGRFTALLGTPYSQPGNVVLSTPTQPVAAPEQVGSAVHTVISAHTAAGIGRAFAQAEHRSASTHTATATRATTAQAEHRSSSSQLATTFLGQFAQARHDVATQQLATALRTQLGTARHEQQTYQLATALAPAKVSSGLHSVVVRHAGLANTGPSTTAVHRSEARHVGTGARAVVASSRTQAESRHTATSLQVMVAEATHRSVASQIGQAAAVQAFANARHDASVSQLATSERILFGQSLTLASSSMVAIATRAVLSQASHLVASAQLAAGARDVQASSYTEAQSQQLATAFRIAPSDSYTQVTVVHIAASERLVFALAEHTSATLQLAAAITGWNSTGGQPEAGTGGGYSRLGAATGGYRRVGPAAGGNGTGGYRRIAAPAATMNRQDPRIHEEVPTS